MRSSIGKKTGTKTKPKAESFEPVEIVDLPKPEGQFSDQGFKKTHKSIKTKSKGDENAKRD